MESRSGCLEARPTPAAVDSVGKPERWYRRGKPARKAPEAEPDAVLPASGRLAYSQLARSLPGELGLLSRKFVMITIAASMVATVVVPAAAEPGDLPAGLVAEKKMSASFRTGDGLRSLAAPRSVEDVFDEPAPEAWRPQSTRSSDAAGSAGWETLQSSGNNSLAVYYDVCDDGPADIHDIGMIDYVDSHEYMFGYQTCPNIPKQPSDILTMWLTDVDFDGYIDYAIGLGEDNSGTFKIKVLDVSSPYESEWYVVYEAAAGWQAFTDTKNAMARGYIPWWAIGGPPEFGFLAAGYDQTSDAVDYLPEEAEGALVFPYTCDYVRFSAAEVTTTPGAGYQLADGLRSRGFRVRAEAGSSLLVDPVTDAQMTLLRSVGAVDTAIRPAVWETLTTLNDPEPNGWAFTQMNAPAGWSKTPSAAVPVAVFDDGIDAGRLDLAGRVGSGYDTVINRSIAAGANSARGAHGTAVASTIAAARGNGQEVAGINPGATVLPYRVTDSMGCSMPAYVAAGLDRLVATGQAKIANISLGGTDPSPAVHAAVRRAVHAGVTVVVSSGNSGGTTPFYPAAYPEVIAVGATGPDGQVTVYSSGGNHIDLVAPGGSGGETRATDIAVLEDFDQIAHVSGTSFSSPYVAGAVSLLKATQPTLTPAQIRDLLITTARDVAPAGFDSRSGYGLLDVGALLASEGTTSPEPEPVVGGAGTSVFDGDPNTTERIASGDVFRAAIAVSTKRFETAGSARHVVLARHDQFADALAGAALTGEGPLLFSFPDRLADPTLDELRRLMPNGGRVYMLGGSAALAPRVADELRAAGLSPTRLHGPSRVETAVAVANQVESLYGAPSQVLIARAGGPPNNPTAAWADAITAGGWAAAAKVPLLLTATESLHPAVAQWIDQRPSAKRVLLGGDAALSGQVWAETSGTKVRVAGRDRAETAAAVATQLWNQPTGGERNGIVFNAWHTSGWAMGLAAAGVAADNGAPLFASNTDAAPQVTVDRLANCTTPAVDVVVMGDTSHVADAVVRQLDAADGKTC